MAKVELTADELGLINRALSDSMNYKPNDRWGEKWSLLLRCKQKEIDMKEEEKRLSEGTELNKGENKSSAERCPWYETAGRISLILGMVAFLYGFFLCMLRLLLTSFEDTLGWWSLACATAQNHPAISVVLFIVGFVVFLVWFIYLVGKRLCGK